MKIKKDRRIILKKPTPEEYSNAKKAKNVLKHLRIAKACKDAKEAQAHLDAAEKLLNKYKKNKLWNFLQLKKS